MTNITARRPAPTPSFPHQFILLRQVRSAWTVLMLTPVCLQPLVTAQAVRPYGRPLCNPLAMASANHYSDESSITTPTSAGFTVASNSNDVNGHADGLAISHRSSTPPLLRAPTGQAFAAHVKMWGPSEIASFLNLYKCDKYTSLFHQNDIDGKVLLDLDMSSLKEIGISKVGDRVKLLGGVRDLRKRASRATTPLTLVNSRVLPIGVSSVEGSPLPVLEQDPRGAQVPKRLAAPGMSGVSKRLQQSRPPPLNLRPSTVQSLDHSSLMTVTPKSFHPQGLQKVVPVPGPETRGVPGYDLAPHLRPPQRDIRRSPSPVHELAPAPKIADRRPLASRPSDRVPSPTNPSTQPRDGPPHPFAIHDGNKWSNRRQGVPQVDTTRRTLEDRRIIKFVNSEDGTSKKIDLPNASSGVEVLELVLRKFGKGNPGSLTNFNVDNDGDGDALQVDGWSVFLRGTGEDGQCLRSLVWVLMFQIIPSPSRLCWTFATAIDRPTQHTTRSLYVASSFAAPLP